MIGILDSSSTLTPRAGSSLAELVETLSYKYGIKGGSWDFVDLQIAMNEEKDHILHIHPQVAQHHKPSPKQCLLYVGQQRSIWSTRQV